MIHIGSDIVKINMSETVWRIQIRRVCINPNKDNAIDNEFTITYPERSVAWPKYKLLADLYRQKNTSRYRYVVKLSECITAKTDH